MLDDRGDSKPTFYKGLPVLTDSELETIQFEQAFGDDSGLHSMGRRVITYSDWSAVLGIDKHHYGLESDSEATPEQVEEFCIGIEEGYEFTLGVLSLVYQLREIPAELALGVGPRETDHFTRIRSNQIPIDPRSDVAQSIDEVTSSELLFEETGDVLAEDEIMMGLIERHEQELKEILAATRADMPLKDIEYHVAGFLHGVASVLGFMAMMHEQANFDAVVHGIDGTEPDVS